jgi:hypothetical protein
VTCNALVPIISRELEVAFVPPSGEGLGAFVSDQSHHQYHDRALSASIH